eukprot:CAMPEP_0183354946 /NCGR_PEP_ID=MMETSP0164_2-20130417/38614_1 /TAXON_ID=221442 /ORGANISM="Coccolithus pelagicus ssp braarudi, Strain PLY182g" /LENGTH=50 /DNA_ID=CAMNT_0025527921 /DNA_START=22 /DNA_END=171 /DNA_ORIENTATION=-
MAAPLSDSVRALASRTIAYGGALNNDVSPAREKLHFFVQARSVAGERAVD